MTELDDLYVGQLVHLTAMDKRLFTIMDIKPGNLFPVLVNSEHTGSMWVRPIAVHPINTSFSAN